MKHTYYANLDIAKSVLALLVVSLHVFLGAVNPRLYPVLNPVTRLAVPTFFILSSYFFFRKVNKTPKHMVGKLLINAERRYIELSWIIHLGIWDMKSHLAGLKATFGALRILTERRSW